ncbi:PAN APPLE domain containing protein [Pandoravirus salinus]|uniref:PAN APPLE domain containing protein n=1 Tax=Pandoravirus salinus TaxID=1349410 RepID=S4W1Z9_9VIRU|nr:PAN APPLE superfamily domain [Pandoravirus salinus]AGO84190.1 PAN APPLE domain containing protein [Pandoravirus salinus]
MAETAVPVAVVGAAPEAIAGTAPAAVIVPPPATPAPPRDYEWVWWAVSGVALAAVLAAVVAWIVHERSKKRAAGALLPVTPASGSGPFYPVAPVTPSPPPPPPNGGPFYPVTPPSSATFTRAANTNTVGTVLADLGLSQTFADPTVGTFSGTAASVDVCEARCRADARCVQYVYDAGAVPPNPLWNRNGCWLRFKPPAANETATVANFITGTRT